MNDQDKYRQTAIEFLHKLANQQDRLAWFQDLQEGVPYLHFYQPRKEDEVALMKVFRQ